MVFSISFIGHSIILGSFLLLLIFLPLLSSLYGNIKNMRLPFSQQAHQSVEKDIDFVQTVQKAWGSCFVQNVPPERFGV